MIKTIIRSRNNMVVVFDERGEQIPEYQGQYEEVKEKIQRDAPLNTVFGYSPPNEGVSSPDFIKPWEIFKRILAFALLGSLALFYLGHFIAFIVIGPVTIGEPNKIILFSEIALFASIVALAMDCFIGDIRKKKPKNNKEGKERFKLIDVSN